MYPFIIYLNMDENIFKYGSYDVDKETLLRSLQYEDNLKGYSQYRRYTPEQDTEFRKIVKYLYDGISNNLITGDGFGGFKDSSQNIYEDNQAYSEALSYVHKIANKIGNSAPKKKTKENDSDENVVFDTSKHGFHNYFLSSLDRFGTTQDYTQLVTDYTNSFGGDLSKAIADFNQRITNYQTKHNNFAGMDISAHGYTTPEEYNADLEKLKAQLSDGSIDPQDRILANSLGIGPVLTAVFGKAGSQSFQNPPASNAFNPQKHGFRSYFAKSISSPFSSGNTYVTDLTDYINQFGGDKQKLGDDIIAKIYDYQKANNSFAEYDFSAYGIKPEDYNKTLEELKNALVDSNFSSSDYYLAKQIGMHDILSEIFGNPTGGSKSGTQTVKVNQEEVTKDLLDQHWTINENNQWVMPNGLVTGFKSNENPIAAIEQMTWGQYRSEEAHLADPDSDTWWTSTLTPSDKKRMWAIMSDVASLIDPEPFTAAGLGYASDYLTHQADKLDGNVSWGRTALNVGLSTLGAVPILGDIALGARIGKNIGKTAKVLTGLLAIPGVVAVIDQAPEIGESWNKMLTNIKSMTVEDWRNVYNVFSIVLGGVNTTRSYAGYRAAKRASQSADDVLQVQVKRNGQTEDIIIQDKQGIDDLLRLKDKPDEFKRYLKDNYEGFDNFELARVTKQKVKVEDSEAGWFRRAIRQNKKKIETEIVSTTSGKGVPDLKTNWWTNRARHYLDDVVLGNKTKRKTNDSTEPTTRQRGDSEAGTTRTGEGDTPTPVTENSQADIIPSTTRSSDTPEPVTSGNVAGDVKPDIQPDIKPDIESNLSKSLRNKDITDKPARPKPTINRESFEGLHQIIHRSKLPGDSKGLARMNLNDLQNMVNTKPDLNRARQVFKGKQAKSKQYKQALSDLMDVGISQKDAKKLLFELGAYKQGGVLKAYRGIKLGFGLDDFDLTANGGSAFFTKGEDGNYRLNDNFNYKQFEQWQTDNNLSITLPYSVYGELPETRNSPSKYDNSSGDRIRRSHDIGKWIEGLNLNQLYDYKDGEFILKDGSSQQVLEQYNKHIANQYQTNSPVDITDDMIRINTDNDRFLRQMFGNSMLYKLPDGRLVVFDKDKDITVESNYSGTSTKDNYFSTLLSASSGTVTTDMNGNIISKDIKGNETTPAQTTTTQTTITNPAETNPNGNPATTEVKPEVVTPETVSTPQVTTVTPEVKSGVTTEVKPEVITPEVTTEVKPEGTTQPVTTDVKPEIVNPQVKGLQIPEGVNLLNDDYQAGWDTYFSLDNQGNYNIRETDSEGKKINEEDRNKWMKSVNLNYTPESSSYGQGYNPNFESDGTVYGAGKKSTGLKGANSGRRTDKLKGVTSAAGDEEIDLNSHIKAMYQDDQEGNRIKDLVGYYDANKGNYKSIDDFLKDYNSTIDGFYNYKRSAEGTTYDSKGNDATKAFNEKYNSVYASHNETLGYDPDLAHINGSSTMARGIDITDKDIHLDVSGNTELQALLGDKKLYKDTNGRIYVKSDATLTSDRKVEEGNDRTMAGDHPIDRTGDTMPTKQKSVDFSPIFSAANYYNALRTNKELYDMTKENQPLLYDTKEDHRVVYGDLRAKAEGQRKAAELSRLASKPMTSDGSLAMATQLEAYNQGQKYIDEGNAADDKALKENMEKAWQQEVENHENRYNVAMKNRENMFAVNKENLLAKANYKRANHESRTKFTDEIKRFYNKKREEKEAYGDSYYKASLQQHMQRNPGDFVSDWTEADTELWEKGQSGQELTSEEQTRYAKLRQLVTQGYYSLLSSEYGTNVAKPSAKWIGTTFEATIPEDKKKETKETKSEKKGGKIDREKAKVIIAYLKESNNNYNKAIDRSIRGLYNHIKLQRK